MAVAVYLRHSGQGAWAYYNDDSSYACPYGKLYNWIAAVDSRQLCPTGWHVPSDAEWSTMINFLDPTADGGNDFSNSNIAGVAMRSAGTEYWYSQDTIDVGTNSSGFSGLPGGARSHVLTSFDEMGFNGYWWSSSPGAETGTALGRVLSWYYSSPGLFIGTISNGCSVRCLRD